MLTRRCACVCMPRLVRNIDYVGKWNDIEITVVMSICAEREGMVAKSATA